MSGEYAAELAPHPWDALGAPPKLSGTYAEPGAEGRTYTLSYTYDAVVRVKNASQFDEADIEATLRELHAEDITRWRTSGEIEDDVDVSQYEHAKPDYSVRLVKDGTGIRAEVVE